MSRPLRWGIVILIAAALTVGIIQILPVSEEAEQETAERVTTLLESDPAFSRVQLAPMDGVHGGVDGRQVFLGGRVADAEQLEALVTAVEAVGGVRRVDATAVQLVPLVANAADYTFSASLADDQVSVRGLAGDFEAQQALLALAGEALGAREDQIIITLADPMPEGWVQSISAALAQLAILENGSIQITGEEAVLSGTATSLDAYRVAEQFANVMAAEGTMPGRVGTLSAALDDFFFTAEKQGQTLRLDGAVPDAESLAGLEAFAAQVLPGFAIESLLLVSSGVPSENWVSDAEAAITAVMSYRQGQATLRAGQVALSGTLADGPLQGQTVEELEASFTPGTTFDTAQTIGAFYTDLDRQRLDLFSTSPDDQGDSAPDESIENSGTGESSVEETPIPENNEADSQASSVETDALEQSAEDSPAQSQ